MLSKEILNLETALVEPFYSNHQKSKDEAHNKMMEEKNKSTTKHNDELNKLESDYSNEVGKSAVAQMELQCAAVP